VWSLRLQPLAGAGEPPGGVIGTLAEVTGMREARRASEAAARTSDTFLSMMSHEIRTPIAGALGIVELLAQTPLDQEQVQLLGMLEDSVDTLLHILGDILDFSRIESGGLVLEPAPCNLRTLVDGLVALFAAQAADKGLRLYASADWRLADEYRCDAGRVRQVLANLLGNAIESTASGPVELRVEMVEASGQGQRLRFSVSHTGAGMPDDGQAAPAMPPLLRHGEPPRPARGAMGLALCRQLAQLMDGRLTFPVRTGEGAVACLEVVLPVLRARVPQPDMAGRVALLCTTDERLGHGLANALSALGFNLIEAAPGDLAGIVADDAHLFVADAPLVAAGRLPRGVRLVRIVGHDDDAGATAAVGVPLQGTPLLWRATVKACHAALDLAPPESTAAAEVPVAPPGARILVAEDHPINRAVISRQLQRLGYPHVLVDDGEQALQALASGHFDLLITDCHMPVLDGYALTYRIRAGEQGSDAHLPIIALSASVLPGQVKYCIDAGMDGFLAKPVQMHELELQLAAHLRQAEARARPAAAPPEPPPDPAPADTSGYHQLALLMEAFGSLCQVREVLRRLLETSRHDMEALDDALREGDTAGQRELLHRIGGSLRLLCESGATDAVAPGCSNRQRRDVLARRLDSLEELLATLDPQDVAVDGG
jgi:CheY-like chemotaxis protein/nitrogen-specific signal transduction histidine kinase